MRVVAGLLFWEHGLQKLFGALAGTRVHLLSLLGLASVLETVGGVLIILGLFTRPVAFILCGEMAFAYFIHHAPRSPWPIVSGGELAVLYCFIFLLLWISGAGPLSLDRLIRRR